MVEIPRYGEQRVLPGIRPAPRQNPGVIQPVGAEIAQAVSRTTQKIGAVVDAERADANRTVVFDSLNKHQQAMNQVLWGENGAMSAEGENAFTQPERVAKDYRKVADELESELTSPEQKAMFRQIVDRQFPDTERNVLVHVGREKEKYRTQTFNSTVATLQQTAINSLGLPAAPQEIQQALLKGQATRALQNPGMSEEALAQVNAADASNLHADIVNTYLARQDYAAAAAYFTARGGDILPDQRNRLQPVVMAGAIKGQEMAIADSLATATDDQGQPLNETEIRNRVVELTKDRPEIRDGAMARAMRDLGLRRSAIAVEQDEVYDAAYREVLNGKPYDEVVNAQMEAAMRPEQIKALKVESGLGGSRPNTKTYDNISSTVDIQHLIDVGEVVDPAHPNDPPRKVTKPMVFAEALAKGLTTAQTEEVLKYYDDRQKVDTVTVTDVNRVLESKDLGTLKDNAARYPDLLTEIQRSLKPGIKATDEEIGKIATKLLAEGEMRGGGYGYGADVTYLEAKQLGVEAEWLPNVSDLEEKAIAETLSKLKDPKTGAQGSAPITSAIIRRFKKYELEGYPTPIANGRPMSSAEAVFMGIVTDRSAVLLPPKAPAGKEAESNPLSYGDDYRDMLGAQ